VKRLFTVAIGIAVATAIPSQAVDPKVTTDQPFHEFQQQELVYSGPADETADLAGLEQVKIGWFGPDDPDHELHGDLWVAASMAIDEANAGGGYRGLPFALLARWSENPWGSGVAEVARLAYEDHVWALLGSVDGPGTHLAEQVVAKARLPLVSPVSTDVSVNLAGVPWMFSLAPSDALWAGVLVDRLLGEIGASDFILLAGTDHDSRLASQAMLLELARRDRSPSLRADLEPSPGGSTTTLEPWITPSPAAVLLAAGPKHSAQIVLRLRELGFEGPVFGTPQMGRNAFLNVLEDVDSTVVLPDLLPSSTALEAFVSRFRERTGRTPDWAAAYTYDATQLLLAAIDRAGLNRARIRDQLAAMHLWEGLTGPIDWDPTGQNRRMVLTATPARMQPRLPRD
jgi:branched-chain amino acid transport system substrate-binding protein